MLFQLVWVVYIWLTRYVVKGQSDVCPLVGQTPVIQSGVNNYVIDLLQGYPFPFAVDQCTATGFTVNEFYKYQCMTNDDHNGNGDRIWTVTKTEYSDSSCSGDGTLVSDWQPTEKESFECDGINTYAEVLISTDAQCGTGITVYAGLGACVTINDALVQMQFFCNSSIALAQVFIPTNESMITTFQPMPSTTFYPGTTENVSFTTTVPLTTGTILMTTAAPFTTGTITFTTSLPFSTENITFTTSVPLSTPNITFSTGAPIPTENITFTTSLPFTTGNISLSSTGVPITTENITLTTSLPFTTGNISLSTEVPYSTPITLTTTSLPFSTPNITLTTGLPFSTPIILTTSLPFSTLNISLSTGIPIPTSTDMPIPTENVSFPTSLSTIIPTQIRIKCDPNSFCDHWILEKERCNVADIAAFEDAPVAIYGKLLSCFAQAEGGEGSTTTTQHAATEVKKSGSSRSQVMIGIIASLVLAVYWL